MEGVTFSEQAWKEFLGFIGSVVETRQAIVGDDSAADKLVAEYYKKNSKPKRSNAEMNEIADMLEDKLYGSYTTWSIADIVHVLGENGYKYSPKGATSLMNSVMKRKPNIWKDGRKGYRCDVPPVEEAHPGEVRVDD